MRGTERERDREKEREMEMDGERERMCERGRERDVFQLSRIVIFIFKRNGGYLGTF